MKNLHGLRGTPSAAVRLLTNDRRAEMFGVGERQLIQRLSKDRRQRLSSHGHMAAVEGYVPEN